MPELVIRDDYAFNVQNRNRTFRLEISEDSEDMREQLERFMANSKGYDTDWSVADWIEVPYSIEANLSEQPDFDVVVNLLGYIETYDGFEAFIGVMDPDLTSGTIEDQYQDAYQGYYESSEDFVKEQVKEIGFAGIPGYIKETTVGYSSSNYQPFEALENYLDWDSITFEFFSDGYYVESNGYIFRMDY